MAESSNVLSQTTSNINITEDLDKNDEVEEIGTRGNILRQALNKYIDGIVSGISINIFKNFFNKIHESNPKILKHIQNQFCDQFNKNIREEIEVMYKEGNVFSSLNKLDQLVDESQSHNSKTTWRPSGIPEKDTYNHLSAIKEDHKKKLQKLCEELENENEKLIPVIKEQRESVMNLISEVQKEVSFYENLSEISKNINMDGFKEFMDTQET